MNKKTQPQVKVAISPNPKKNSVFIDENGAQMSPKQFFAARNPMKQGSFAKGGLKKNTILLK